MNHPRTLWVTCPACTFIIRAHVDTGGTLPDEAAAVRAYEALSIHLRYGCVSAVPAGVGAQDAP